MSSVCGLCLLKPLLTYVALEWQCQVYGILSDKFKQISDTKAYNQSSASLSPRLHLLSLKTKPKL